MELSHSPQSLEVGVIASFRLSWLMFIAPLALLPACARVPAVGRVAAGQSILQSSSPAGGSIVAAPVNALELRFNPPARLGEVSITGPQGVMPMMVTAVGEVGYYSLPLPDLGPGNYKVNWAVTASGRAYDGNFAFTVR